MTHDPQRWHSFSDQLRQVASKISGFGQLLRDCGIFDVSNAWECDSSSKEGRLWRRTSILRLCTTGHWDYDDLALVRIVISRRCRRPITTKPRSLVNYLLTSHYEADILEWWYGSYYRVQSMLLLLTIYVHSEDNCHPEVGLQLGHVPYGRPPSTAIPRPRKLYSCMDRTSRCGSKSMFRCPRWYTWRGLWDLSRSGLPFLRWQLERS